MMTEGNESPAHRDLGACHVRTAVRVRTVNTVFSSPKAASLYYQANKKNQLGFDFSLPPRGVLPVWLEEQSGSGCGESGSFAGQSQHQRLQHGSSPGSFVTVFARLPD